MKIPLILLSLVLVIFSASPSSGGEKLHYDFEVDEEGWGIPDWSFYKEDHRGISAGISSDQASSGTSSMKLECDFPGDLWAAAVIELRKDHDLSMYETISADVYLPKKAPRDIMKVRLILVTSNGWYWTEMRVGEMLQRGKWVTVKAKLESEEPQVSEWKGKEDKRLFLNIRDIRTIIVRIEYDAAPPFRVGPRYKGPIYIDNIICE